MHAFRPTNELARTDFSISPEGDVSWYTGTFSTDEKIAGREDLCGEHYAVPAVHACHLENNTCFAYMDGRRMVVYIRCGATSLRPSECRSAMCGW